MRYLMVYITARDKKQACGIGKTLVAERFAACANIFDGISSFYFWEKRLHADREAVLIVKTRDTLLKRLIKRVKELHSYSVPCIVAIPIAGGSEEYLSWLKKETEAGRRVTKRRLSKRPV